MSIFDGEFELTPIPHSQEITQHLRQRGIDAVWELEDDGEITLLMPEARDRQVVVFADQYGTLSYSVQIFMETTPNIWQWEGIDHFETLADVSNIPPEQIIDDIVKTWNHELEPLLSSHGREVF